MYTVKDKPTVQFYNGDKLISVDGNFLTAEYNPQISDKADPIPILFDASYDTIEDKLTLMSEDGSATAVIYHPVFADEPRDKFKCKISLFPEK